MGVKPEDIERAIADGNKVLAQLRRVCPTPEELARPTQGKRIRQSTKPLLNKLETEWGIRLVELYPRFHIRAQVLRFRLANGLSYKPDFTMVAPYEGAFAWEVKGPHAFRGGFENLKMAASVYPEWTWILVWKDQCGLWQTQRVFP